MASIVLTFDPNRPKSRKTKVRRQDDALRELIQKLERLYVFEPSTVRFFSLLTDRRLERLGQ